MKTIKKLTFAASVSLIITSLGQSVLADSSASNPFLSGIQQEPHTLVARGFSGKPPFRNRPQILKQRKLERTEIAAFEIQNASEKKSNLKRKLGHPLHSKRFKRRN